MDDAAMPDSSPPASDPLRRAHAALCDLADVDLATVDDDALCEQLLELQQLRARLDATEAQVLSAWDGRRCWHPSGARSGAAWLAWQERVPIGDARRRIRHARACREHPAIAAAWTKGRIDRTHVATLLRARTPRTAEAFEADHLDLVEAASTYDFAGFRRICQRWETAVDPDGAEQTAEDARAARELHLSQTFDDMWFARGTFDPISGQIVHDTLAAIDQELFDADWAAATQRLGHRPTVDDLDRTPAQRRADALVEMAIRSRTAPVGGRRPEPLFTVVVGLETLQGPVLELFNRTILTPATAAAWLSRADVERIVFEGASRVLDVGAERRFFRGALRRAIEVRDRVYYHPSCNQPPERPQIDHIDEASKGGPTTQDNGRLACSYHNRWRNHHPDPADDDPQDDPGGTDDLDRETDDGKPDRDRSRADEPDDPGGAERPTDDGEPDDPAG